MAEFFFIRVLSPDASSEHAITRKGEFQFSEYVENFPNDPKWHGKLPIIRDDDEGPDLDEYRGPRYVAVKINESEVTDSFDKSGYWLLDVSPEEFLKLIER